MRSQLYSLLKFAIGWPLSLIAFFFIGKIIYDQSSSVLPNIQSINLFLTVAGTLCLVIFYFLRSFLWYRIIKAFGHKIPFRESSYMWSISELKRYIPGNIWSFLGRTVLFTKHGVSKKEIAAGLIIEAELFVLGCFIVSLLSLPFLLPQYSAQMMYLAITIIVIIVALYVFNNNFLKHAHKGFLHRMTQYLFPPFPSAENAKLIAVSSVALFFFGMGNYLLTSAVVGTDPQLVWQLVGVFVFAFVVGYLSIVTPAGFGVREGIVVYGLSKIMPAGIAAFAALFTRVMLIIAELIFILITYLWYKSKNKYVQRAEHFMAKYPYEMIVLFMSVVYAVYFSAVSMLRYQHYYTGRFDLGNMVQTVWNTLHGNFFMMTNPDSIGQVSRLAFHADFILILLTPFYFLWEDPKMLLLIQAVVVAAGAFFVYLIAKEVIKDRNISVVLAFAYLINPSVQRANIYDFHAVVLATTFLLATFYFLLKKQYRLFIIFAVLSAFCKEQIWLIIGLFGILIMIMHRKWVIGAGIFAFCVGMFFFLVNYAIPSAHGSDHFALEYYSEFGGSTFDIVKGVLASPDKVIQLVFEPERMKFIKQIFSPLGYLSYLFPFFLIFAGPDLLISILSSNSNLHQIYYQYTATMTPFIFISAIYGIWVLQKLALWVDRKEKFNSLWSWIPAFSGMTTKGMRGIFSIFVIVYVLYWALSTAYQFGPLPGAKEPNIAMFHRPFPDEEFINQVIYEVPVEYSISASNNLGSHLSQREVIYVLPHGIDQADMVLISDKDGYAKETIAAMEKNKNYEKRIDRNGFVVYEKLHK